VKLRRAGPHDRERLLAWRNRPEIVALGSSQRTVRPDEHDAWYARVSADARTRLYIIESDAGEPIGQVRFDPHHRHPPYETAGESREAVVSIYLLAEHTGRGEGTRALTEATREAAAELGLARVWAVIREDNLPSQTSFARAGYTRCTTAAPTALVCAAHIVHRWETSP
jgi:RimJ/RimL family protein N-acetyltransferase